MPPIEIIPRPLSLILVGLLAVGSTAQTWCGKHYSPDLPVVPPGGNFPIPVRFDSPQIALRCSPAIRPYLPEDVASSDTTFASIIIDAPITYSGISNAVPIKLPSTTSTGLEVRVTIDGKTLTRGTVKLNSTKTLLPFSLRNLQPRKTPYDISCTASFSTQTFHATSSLSYLPNPPSTIGSVTKMDMRTGALLARPANGKGGPYTPVFPVHPIPSFGSLTALDLVLDEMQQAGLYLMYDMRGTYQNKTSVTEQVNRIKSRPNLLLWYTADEPDGTTDPLNATSISSNLIKSLDGGDGKGGVGYHPVSLVLNCQDYFFNEYTRGADIVMQDAYTIGNNATFSTVWNTVCTKDFGDCG
ncbi:hypothetical protein H0H81_006959 [Sphagnurus paluster]|uniref:Uncharacterized protein n=1 Tax=Sphagnurus paluster TaxID=117069 RepID=A0A9P7GKT2_9AGAR|nr:hypothetical protein H0H81_006959 [Sphagnurus paluster]